MGEEVQQWENTLASASLFCFATPLLPPPAQNCIE